MLNGTVVSGDASPNFIRIDVYKRQVPVWLVVLSDQLLIVALVSRYLTNWLISHRPLRSREALAAVSYTHLVGK